MNFSYLLLKLNAFFYQNLLTVQLLFVQNIINQRRLPTPWRTIHHHMLTSQQREMNQLSGLQVGYSIYI